MNFHSDTSQKLRYFLTRSAAFTLLFTLAFLAGGLVARCKETYFPAKESAADTPSLTSISSESVSLAETENWGLSFQQDGEPPIANVSAENLKKYNAYYANMTDKKVLYLTFDAGFENGNTPAILDALKKHHAPATFFVVGTYIESNPELIQRMTEEGHIIGNHTYHHPDMSQISTTESFSKELQDVETAYQEVTGKEMLKYYRPPQGKYSESNLQMAKDLGYTTFFWSLAYVDWYENDQPTHEEALEKLTKRIHPGAIVLLHSTSKTNAEILDELLTKWEEMGYTFQTLTQLAEES